jgi:uncharacterized protein YndB with AHSA1/START domain
MTSTTAVQTVQVHRVYIKAPAQAVWDAITKPEWTERYGYGGQVNIDLRPGGAYKAYAGEEMKKGGAEMGIPIPDVVVDGEVIEANPPHKLVLTWRMCMDPGLQAESYTRLTYEVDEMNGGFTKLTLIHDLTGAPNHAYLVAGDGELEGGGGGWPWVLSDLKSLLETGSRLTG